MRYARQKTPWTDGECLLGAAEELRFQAMETLVLCPDLCLGGHLPLDYNQILIAPLLNQKVNGF